MQEIIQVKTSGKGLHDCTSDVTDVVRASEVQEGLCNVFIQHTSASLLIQENADPSARRDLEEYFERIAPEGESWYTHTTEGPDDLPSHLRSALTSTSETIPVRSGSLALGTWQGLFLFEHRRRGRQRNVVISVRSL